MMRFSLFAAVIAVGIAITVGMLVAPPSDFPEGESLVIIPKGASVSQIATQLSEQRIVAHPEILRTILRITGRASGVQSGIYLFKEPQNLFTVTFRLSVGEYGIPPVRVTFIEGETARQYAQELGSSFPLASPQAYLAVAKPYEGYLFPDTYLLQPSSEPADIIAAQRANFEKRLESLEDDIKASGRSLSEIVILASILEKEARTEESRRMVAGILLNRLKIGMPLQVDAVFGYIFDRPTYHPSLDDLKVDSPYNTYKYRGLPPGPIGNPGLDAIEAALNPAKTPYLYYLTGKDNLMHYAETFEGHQRNREKYL